MKIFHRYLENNIKEWISLGKVIIIYGARQVGKTTLVKKIIDQYPGSVYLNCERQLVKDLLETNNIERIRSYIGETNIVVFDEAQKVRNIGPVLKLLHDTFPEIQIIATGSSSFELSSEIIEPLTGRNVKFILYPLSVTELQSSFGKIKTDEMLDNILRFGLYPDIVLRGEKQKITLLDELATDYLFRDVLRFENLRKSDLLFNLLKALALQLGNEVSMRELSGLLKTSVETVQKYIHLLEQSFVIFRLSSFSRNLRNELSRSQKFYFYDTGIRNSLLQNYNILPNRTDTGALWENFCIIERMKYLQKTGQKVNQYFWRTYQQKEIDLIEESRGKLMAYEFKWNPDARVKVPKEFLKTYAGSEFRVIHRGDFGEFIGEKGY